MIRFPDLDALSRHAAAELAALTRDAAGPFHVALSGGSTPKRLFGELVTMQLPWDRIELWWGDERCVPPDHPDSNYGMTKKALLDPLHIDPARVHRIEAEGDPDAAAAKYAAAIPKVFDLVYLGMGPDGHTASLFPGSPALEETARACVANRVDSPLTHGPATRITLTYPVFAAARAVRFLVGGADKADALARIAAGADLPAARVRGHVEWFVDAAAAAKLEATS